MGLHLRRRTACLTTGAALLLVSGALAAQASAATISLNTGCYVNLSPTRPANVEISGSGFSPSTSIDIDGDVFGTATSDAAGNFVTIVQAPAATVTPGAKKFTVTASDEDPTTFATVSASTTGYYTLGGLSLPDHAVGFGTKITYDFGGFRTGKQIYGHYFIGKRLVGRKQFGKAKGPCGTLKTKATGYPISKAHPNKWTVYYDDVKKFSKKAFPTYVLGFHKI